MSQASFRNVLVPCHEGLFVDVRRGVLCFLNKVAYRTAPLYILSALDALRAEEFSCHRAFLGQLKPVPVHPTPKP